MALSINIKFPAQTTSSIVTGRLALDYVRPQLTGSEKQIAWAEDIRAEREAEILKFIKMIFKIAEADDLFYSDGDNSALLSDINSKLSAERDGKSMVKFFEQILCRTSAKEWIDARDENIHSLARAY